MAVEAVVFEHDPGQGARPCLGSEPWSERTLVYWNVGLVSLAGIAITSFGILKYQYKIIRAFAWEESGHWKSVPCTVLGFVQQWPYNSGRREF